MNMSNKKASKTDIPTFTCKISNLCCLEIDPKMWRNFTVMSWNKKIVAMRPANFLLWLKSTLARFSAVTIAGYYEGQYKSYFTVLPPMQTLQEYKKNKWPINLKSEINMKEYFLFRTLRITKIHQKSREFFIPFSLNSNWITDDIAFVDHWIDLIKDRGTLNYWWLFYYSVVDLQLE